MPFLDSIRAHQRAGTALLAANFYNAETLLAVLRAAERTGSEVILQTSPSTISYLGIHLAAGMARGAARDLGVTAWLHLDHAQDLDLIRACIDAGYDSVMIDASDRPLDENIRITSEAVAMAHAAGVAVEAELGYIPKLGEADVTEAGLTSPAEAEQFVEATHVDLLAVAFGTAHGFYKHEPKIDLARLAAIHERIATPLVMHGASALPPNVWRESIRRGIVKINFATEIKDTFTRALQASLSGTSDIDLRNTFPPAIDAASRLVEAKLRVCAAGGCG